MANRLLRSIAIAATIPMLICLAPRTSHAQQGLTLELNRLVTDSGMCRLFFLVRNGLDRHFPELVIDVGFFDKKGVIIGRANIDFRQVRAHKTSLRSVGFTDFTCAQLGRVLLNDVVSCGNKNAASTKHDCLDLLTLQHKGEVEFFK